MMNIRVNSKALAAVLGVPVDTIMHVPDERGVPTSREWRNRIRDAAIDKCVTVVKNAAKTSKGVKHAKR